MREAYSHEVISHGFWPGSGPVLEPAFYAYAVPEPPGLKEAPVEPAAAPSTTASWASSSCPTRRCARPPSPETGDRRVRRQHLRKAADLGGWDRVALERAG